MILLLLLMSGQIPFHCSALQLFYAAARKDELLYSNKRS
jgi:hypothetical protein